MKESTHYILFIRVLIGLFLSTLLLVTIPSKAEGYDSISVIEYFIDIDPGIGNGTILDNDSTPAYVSSQNIDLSSLSNGIHTIYFRARDNKGYWGALFGKSFYVYRPLETDTANMPLENIEYAFNSEAFSSLGGIDRDTVAEIATNLDMSVLPNGIHTIYFRTQDSTGFRSVPFGKSFYVYRPLETDTANMPLENLEYAFNSEAFSSLGAIDRDTVAEIATNLDMSVLPNGIHTIYFRTQDSTGFRSVPFGKSFYVYRPLETDTANMPLENLEYAFNSEAFSSLGGIDRDTVAEIATNLDMSVLPNGIHTIYFRTQDSTGFMSVPFGKSFYVYTKTIHDSVNVPLVDLEYSFDSISGFTSLGTFDPDTAVTLNADLIESLIGHGDHTLSFRAKDARNFYSSVVSCSLNFINEAPVANAGETRFVGENTQVLLNGLASTDRNKDVLNYFWIAPQGIVLSSYTDAEPSFTAPAITNDTVYTFVLYVNDGSENSANDTVRIVVIHNEVAISDTTLTNIVSDCINAFDNITIAGDGELVIFDTGSVNTLIAGKSIHFLHGFHSRSGSYVNAYITSNAWYCDDILQLLVAPDPVVEKSINAEYSPENDMFNNGIQRMKVYPNPNSGIFTLQLNNFEANTRIFIFNSLGQTVYSTATSENSLLVELPGIKKGIYHIKAINNNNPYNSKIVVK
jgi:hypothetical protein